MNTDDDTLFVLIRESVEHCDKLFELLRRAVLLAVNTYKKIFRALEVQSLKHLRFTNTLVIVTDHFIQRGPRLDDTVRRQSLAEQVLSCNGTVPQIYVTS